eukprot:CAMPEP_0197550238 /NCGR_PEP_ID=MMETSP1320-20131121/3904_1 /TAXON_ID=91990 /ORGANISM="Bolidomonas sp., Strain RCC2347" /LENGTH=47 /DNA_ID= /DNA_START= /DNA_END= /DNA_ORIENTATION=
MSLKRCSDEAEAPHTAIIPQSANSITEDTTIALPDDVWVHIVSFVGA